MGTSYISQQNTQQSPLPRDQLKLKVRPAYPAWYKAVTHLFQIPQGTPNGSHGPVAYSCLAPERMSEIPQLSETFFSKLGPRRYPQSRVEE